MIGALIILVTETMLRAVIETMLVRAVLIDLRSEAEHRSR